MSLQTSVKTSAPLRNSFVPNSQSLLQRKCACGGGAGLDGMCEECRDKRLSSPYRASNSNELNPMPPCFGHDFSKMSISPVTHQTMQPKLQINQPGDMYEQEADHMAEMVMRMPDSRVSAFDISPCSVILHRKCACGGNAGPEGECEECRSKRLQRRAANGIEPMTVPPIVHEVLRSPGQPLDSQTRAFFEPRFGHDFSRVRVHTDAEAAESAWAVNALAYTVGRDMVFGAGQYAPGARTGQSLLAHELTHVAQQRGNGESAATLAIGLADANEEQEARSAEAIVNTRGNYEGPSLLSGSRVLRRKEPETAGGAPSGGTAQPNVTLDCLQSGTNQQMPVEPKTVTVIEYGEEWCDPCRELKKDMDDLCKSYRTKKPAVPVRFFAADTNVAEHPIDKMWPPVPGGGIPRLLIYSGQLQLFSEEKITAEQLKQKVDKAIACANKPSACSPIVPKNCPIISATPDTLKGARFLFNVATVTFAPGEQARLEAFLKGVKAAAPSATVNILGLASSDGNADLNNSLSCHRALFADSFLRKEGITIDKVEGTGGVPGTDNKPEFRAVDLEVKTSAGPVVPPSPPGKTPSKNTCPDPPPKCVFDVVITGPSQVKKKAKDKNATGKQRKQAENCDPFLFQIVPNPKNPNVTSNTKILHVAWKKDPPPDTLSVIRTANDNEGDAPAGKVASFASLDPTTDSKWKQTADALKVCPTTLAQPAWCVPLCSFGKFTMTAWVTWQCDPTNCQRNDVFQVPTFVITMDEIP